MNVDCFKMMGESYPGVTLPHFDCVAMCGLSVQSVFFLHKHLDKTAN